jgi:hypothetical protein
LYFAVGAVLVALLGSATVLISQQPPPGAPGTPAAPDTAAAPAARPAATPASIFPTMTYTEFINKHPEGAYSQIPERYKRTKLTETQWLQLARIFRGAREVGLAARRGRIGRELYAPAAKLLAGMKAEMDIMKEIHDQAVESAWWFECSFPRISVTANDPDNAYISFDVIKHVRCGNFADRLLRRLGPLSGRGEGRVLFTVLTQDGGMFGRHQLYLSAEAVSYWPTLWSGDTIEARVFDVGGGEMLPAPMLRSAGHTGATILEMVYPPEIYYTGDPSSAFPRSLLHGVSGMYEYMPEYRYYRRQDGKLLPLDGVEGWLYTGWSFTLPMARVAEIDRIEAKLVAGAPRAAGAGGAGGFGGDFEEEDEEEFDED